MILVLGASGFLGSHCFHEIRQQQLEVVGTYKQNASADLRYVNLESSDSVRRLLTDVKPDAVIWCAMNHTHADEATLNEAALNVIHEFHPNIRMIFVSTDGVLPGMNGPFSEDAQPKRFVGDSPIATYTNAKLDAEHFIERSFRNYCVARVGPIYGRSISGFWDRRIGELTNALKNNQKCARATNFLRSFINVHDLSGALCELVQNNYQGIVHLGPEKIESNYTFAIEVAKAFGYSPHLVEPFTIPSEDVRTREVRLDTTMDTRLSRALLGTVFRPVSEALKANH